MKLLHPLYSFIFKLGLALSVAFTFAQVQVKTLADFSRNFSQTDSLIAVLNVPEGDIKIDLDFKNTPLTVANFETLCKKGFYDGVKFHRVIPQFVVQGGDPQGSGMGGPGYNISDEKSVLSHEIGALSMANTGAPNSGGSQFFMVLAPQKHLDGKHAVFGQIIFGLEHIYQIEAGEKINSCKIIEKIKLNKTKKPRGK